MNKLNMFLTRDFEIFDLSEKKKKDFKWWHSSSSSSHTSWLLSEFSAKDDRLNAETIIHMV